MSHVPRALSKRLTTLPYVCSRCLREIRERPYKVRLLQTASTTPDPFRKQLKDQAKAQKASGKRNNDRKTTTDTRLQDWELTVGIEIHAELNTARKLFSSAHTSCDGIPNTHVSVFDAAFPGAQPEFQKATLIPAIRAALALGCDIQSKSSWDRKHYFHWDQPQGYQITQYYEPFAKNGSITLYPHDGIDPADGSEVTIGIKQVQMEQDTAKTIQQPPRHLLDFNRVSHPLIEIITLPQIHSPLTAAACVRKIQAIVSAVGAATAGMEIGGLRADVNVSVRRRNGSQPTHTAQSYAGVTGLGTRTEIKNLSSLKAVEEAIITERDRQISVLEEGGVIEGETRGWTIGQKDTTRLRRKEGEVDYRYMPDADLSPVLIGNDLVEHLRNTLPALPDELLTLLTSPSHGLSMVDAQTLIALNDGDRLDCYFAVVDQLQRDLKEDPIALKKAGKTAANWVLHEMGGLLVTMDTPWIAQPIPSSELATLLGYLLRKEITGKTAKEIFARLFELSEVEEGTVSRMITEEGLLLRPMQDSEYETLALEVVANNEDAANAVRVGDKRANGKFMFLVGCMMRLGPEGRMEAERAKLVLQRLLDGAE